MNGSIALDYARNRVGVSDRRAQDGKLGTFKHTTWATEA